MAFENLKKTGITYVLTKLKDIFLQIKDAVKSVNGIEADANGDITLSVVPYAQNLQSESSQRSVDAFIIRTAGGTSSIENGDAWLMSVKGNSIHEGYVPESLVWSVTAVERANPITAEIDRDTFVAEVSESGTTQLIYSDGWTTDPSVYGITVTGTPVNGDIITVVYVKEERGIITVANPMSIIGTGWNLYNHNEGYARALKYDDNYGFGISGTYTALKFSTTLDGVKGDIVVTDGHFDVPSDGYVWVTGGNSTDTAIWMTWSDWTEGYVGNFATYTEDEADLSAVMGSYFPYGLLKAGSVQDEIDLNIGQAISRVERLAYTEEARASAVASGREFEFDDDYIYLARSSAVINSVTVDGSVSVDDHGLEMFTQTDVPVYAEILYGNNLKNKLERDVLQISQQTLTAAQQEQARNNIGAAGMSDIPTLPAVEILTTTVTKCSKNNVGNFNNAFKYGNIIILPIDVSATSAITAWSEYFMDVQFDLTDIALTSQICSVAFLNASSNAVAGYLYAQKRNNKISICASVNMSSGTRYRGFAVIVLR